METIGITGGTGFVGRHLTRLLVSKGYKVVIFTTRVAKKPAQKQVSFAHWNPRSGAFDINALKEVTVVVNLAGAGIADKRWSEKRKKEIKESRIKATEFLVGQLKTYCKGCKTLIAASATGFYGPDRGGAPFKEDAEPYNDFLAGVCKQWEASSMEAASFLRTVIFRFGIVLGKESGAFREFSKPMSLGVMPVLGNGGQVMSWIEVNDLARLILFAIEHEPVNGIYNAVAPQPVAHAQLMKTIADAKGGIKIPIHVPAPLLKILLGEMSTEILKSCTVSPEKILAAGFTYKYPEIKGAVEAIVSE